MDPELLPGSRIVVPDPDPAKNSACIRNFCLDPNPELGKFQAGSGITHSGSATLHIYCTRVAEPEPPGAALIEPEPPRRDGSGKPLLPIRTTYD